MRMLLSNITFTSCELTLGKREMVKEQGSVHARLVLDYAALIPLDRRTDVPKHNPTAHYRSITSE
jgi:hypothetical protein